MTVSIDFETRSTVDLKRCGLYVYAESPETEVLCMAYAFEGEAPALWTPGSPLPSRLVGAVRAGADFRAWNATFERVIWRDILGPQYGFPVPDLEQWWCTAAEARIMALPRALGWAAEILRVPTPKDKEGRALTMKMCKPQKDGTYFGGPEELARLGEYCKTDVVVERAVAKKLRPISRKERAVFLMDQRMNDRGYLLDVDLVAACRKLAKVATKDANARLSELTDGAVTKVTQVARMKDWLATAHDMEVDSIAKEYLRDLLAEDADTPVPAQEMLQIRQAVGKTSTGKLDAMVRARCEDNYARGGLMYHGASTGRWAGQLIQPQNFPRGEVKGVEDYIPEVLTCPDPWPHEDPDAMAVVTSLLRGCIIAPPGHRLLVGDYAQIEARVLGWIAGEPYGDLEYERMAAAIYGIPVEEIVEEHARGESECRKVGKDTVLGCGYQMGHERYVEQAWERSGLRLTEAFGKRAVGTYRGLKPGIVAFWSDIEATAREAVEKPGLVTHVGVGGCIRFVVKKQFLWAILPSGRPLAYALPRVMLRETKWGPRRQLTYMGIHPKINKWKRLSTYGGHLTENVVQAMARDIMAESMVTLDRRGYAPVLTVHDEVVGAPLDGHGSLSDFTRILEQVPAWARGCPIKAECWEGTRYRKA